MRVSSYNIYVELNNNPKYYFLVHGYTGAIDLIKKEIALLLKNTNDSELLYQLDKETLDSLIKRGYITNKTKEEERKHLQTLSELVHKKKSRANSFLFIVTQNCNFRCPYCFENSLSNNGKSWSKSVFTKELVDKAYDAIEKIQPDREQCVDSIGLYGGEPLLKENYDIIEYIIQKGREKDFTFRATTNGYDLDHFTSLLGDEGINRLQISIDGLKNTNNQRRVHFQNKDTFSKIMSNISIALERGVKVMNRINIDKSNFGEIEDLMQYYKEEGFLEYNNFTPYVAKVVGHETNCNDTCGDEFNSIEFYKKAIALKEKNPESNKFYIPDFDIKKTVRKNIENNSIFIPRSTFCGANNGMLIFDSNGDIYTCGEKIGVKNHIVGTFHNGLKFNNKVLNAWLNRSVGNIDQCSKCKYAFWCGGGCGAELKPKEDININRSNCQDFPKVFSEIINEFYDNEYSKIIERQAEKIN